MREEHLVQEFIAEAEEHLLRLEPQLLQLEQEPDNAALVHDIFVATHALKGTAAYVGLGQISEFTHLLESVLDRLRQQELPVSADIIDGLLQGLDSLRRLIQHVAAGQPLPDTSESARQLTDWLTPTVEPARAPAIETSQAASAPSIALSAAELQALDPDDVDIFADIAGQQLAAMRFAFERLERAFAPENGPSEPEVRSAAAALRQAFQTLQSSAMPLALPSLHAIVAQSAPLFAALAAPEALAQPTREHISQTFEIFEQVLAILAGQHRQAPPSPPGEPSPATSTPVDQTGIVPGSQMLRVDVGRIDALVNLAGELVANRAQLARLEHVLEALHDDVRTGADAFLCPLPESRKTTVRLLKRLKEQLAEVTANLGRLAHQFQDGAMRVRMIPISQVVNRFPRMVRDLSRQSGKTVRLDIQGADTELDKSVLDMLADPLIHLLRNAIDHGIEMPEERVARGKDAQGRILLSAAHEGNQVVITLQDDGRGMDATQVRQKAIQHHVITAADAAAMTDDEVLALIFRTGFSTLDRASYLSGRGVGLHLVKRYLERVNGAIACDTQPGAGTTFVLTFPLTLAIIPALLVSIQTDLYAIPLTAVEEAVSIPEHDITVSEARRWIPWRDARIPLVTLTELFGEPGTPTVTEASGFLLNDMELPLPQAEEIFPDPFFEYTEPTVAGVIISAGHQALGLVVEHFLGESDIVITAIEHDLITIDGISGVSIQSDGRIAFVLDAAALIRLAGR